MAWDLLLTVLAHLFDFRHPMPYAIDFLRVLYEQ